MEHAPVYALLLEALSSLESAVSLMQGEVLPSKSIDRATETYVQTRIALAEIERLRDETKKTAASVGAIDLSASGMSLDSEWDPRVFNRPLGWEGHL
jgi:hypothetical protein